SATPPYALQFDLQRSVTPAFIDIQKLPPTGITKDIILQDTINNPAGWTHIVNTSGNITASGGKVQTNALDINASGGIGTSTARLPVDLIQSLDRGRVINPSDDRVRTTQLYAVATNDVFLDLTGYDRVPDSYASRPNPFIVYVDHVQSTAGSVNLKLEDSIRQ